MKKITSLFCFLFLVFSVFATAPEKLTKALQGGDATSLSEMFASNIDLTTPNNNGVYSKEQAKLVLENWFNSNKPSSVALAEEQNNGNSSKYVYSVSTSSGNVIITIIASINGSTISISEFKIQ